MGIWRPGDFVAPAVELSAHSGLRSHYALCRGGTSLSAIRAWHLSASHHPGCSCQLLPRLRQAHGKAIRGRLFVPGTFLLSPRQLTNKAELFEIQPPEKFSRSVPDPAGTILLIISSNNFEEKFKKFIRYARGPNDAVFLKFSLNSWRFIAE